MTINYVQQPRPFTVIIDLNCRLQTNPVFDPNALKGKLSALLPLRVNRCGSEQNQVGLWDFFPPDVSVCSWLCHGCDHHQRQPINVCPSAMPVQPLNADISHNNLYGQMLICNLNVNILNDATKLWTTQYNLSLKGIWYCLRSIAVTALNQIKIPPQWTKPCHFNQYHIKYQTLLVSATQTFILQYLKLQTFYMLNHILLCGHIEGFFSPGYFLHYEMLDRE